MTEVNFIPVISQYKKLTNDYSQVCSLHIQPGSQELGATVSTLASSSIDPTNNFYTFTANAATVDNVYYGSVVVTVDLNSCTQYWVSFNPSYSINIAGPEFAYNK